MNTYLVRVHFNTERRWNGFEHGDTLVPGAHEPFDLTCDSPEEAAEDVFVMFNRDDRANRSYERSVSVGDVIQLTVSLGLGHEIHIWMAVEGRGFRQVDGPVLETA